MKKISFISIFIFGLIYFPLFIKADAGPVYFSRSGAIYSGEETNVVMNYEKVIFNNFRIEEMKYYDRVFPQFAVDVSADFILENTGDQAEDMVVYFPIYPSIKEMKFEGVFNIKIFVDDKIVNYQKEYDKILFNVLFEPKKETKIRVEYSNLESFYSGFSYILYSGAGWKDKIKYGEFIIEFKYPPTKCNIYFGDYYGGSGGPLENSNYKIEGNKLVSILEDFEPTSGKNITFSMVYPDFWQEYLEAKKDVEENPLSYEKHLELAKIYYLFEKGKKVSSDPDCPGEKLYFEEIEKLLEIKYPEDNKPLEYYIEASDYYTDNWHLEFEGKGDFVINDLIRLAQVREELINDQNIVKNASTTELIEKINLALEENKNDNQIQEDQNDIVEVNKKEESFEESEQQIDKNIDQQTKKESDLRNEIKLIGLILIIIIFVVIIAIILFVKIKFMKKIN